MRCQEFESVLEQTSEQPMPAEASAHAAQCGNCHSLAADLEAIAAMARELFVPDEEPPARVWTQLRAQLEAEGIIHAPEFHRAEADRAGGWFAGVLAWMRRPVMVAAYAAVMVLAAGLAWQHNWNTDEPN